MTHNSRSARPIMIASVLALGLTLAACDRQRDDTPPEPAPTVSPSAEPSQSIIRDGFDEPEDLAPLATLEGRIGFPDGGADLDEAALEELGNILASDQIGEGWPIILRAHSDAGGNDTANMRMTASRGQAVADWLVENGVADDRITVIEFGEQNPVEPNANPDGTPNDAGRAANRRVDVTIEAPGNTAPQAVPAVEPEAE